MASSTLSCTICVDNFENSRDICSTVCGHVFHFSCLQQWQERSNTCPLCNQINPQPHRLFLDTVNFKTELKTEKDDCNEYIVVIKGIKNEQLLTTPLSTIVLNLAQTMNLSIRPSDIRDVSRNGKHLHVKFYASRYKDMFLENKFKLKANHQTSGVIIHELLDEETQELFHHAHKLKALGYKTIFVKNKVVYAKKDKKDTPLSICSKDYVDSLCGNSTPSQLANTSTRRNPRRKVSSARPHNAATSTASQLANTGVNQTHRSTVTSARPYNPAATTSSQFRNTAANPTNRNTVASYNAATAPAIQLTAPIITHRSTVASAPPYNPEMDTDSADLIRRIMMEDFIADSIPSVQVHGDINHINRQDNNRLGFVEQGQEITWRRFDSQPSNSPQTKSFKKSIVSLFQSITRKFK